MHALLYVPKLFLSIKKTTCMQIKSFCNANLCLQLVFEYLQNIFWNLKSKLCKSDIRSASSKLEGTPSLFVFFFFHFAWRSLCDFPSDKHQECKQQVRGDTQSQLRHRQLHAAAPCRSVKRQIQKQTQTNK